RKKGKKYQIYEDVCERKRACADTLAVPAGKTRGEDDETFRDGNGGVRLLLHSLASCCLQPHRYQRHPQQSTGAITVTGTIVCTTGDLFVIETNIIQVSGGRNGFTTGLPITNTCSGGVDTWVAPQTLRFGSIKNGDAQVVTEAIDLTDGSIVQEVFHQPVTPVPYPERQVCMGQPGGGEAPPLLACARRGSPAHRHTFMPEVVSYARPKVAGAACQSARLYRDSKSGRDL